MSEDIKLYYYKRWRKAEGFGEKMEILYDFLVDNEEAEEFFGLDLEEIELLNTIELEEYYEEYSDYIEEKWQKLIYDFEEEEDDDDED